MRPEPGVAHQRPYITYGPLLRITKFTPMAAERNASTHLGMLDAGSLLVLTVFANADFRLPNLLNVLDGKGSWSGERSYSACHQFLTCLFGVKWLKISACNYIFS